MSVGSSSSQSRVRRPARTQAPAGGPVYALRWGLPPLMLLLFALLTLHSYHAVARPLAARLSSAPRSDSLSDLQSHLAPLFSPTVQRWAPLIHEAARGSGLPAALIATVIQIESCGDPAAVSSAGALGLMQVMPYHFTVDQDPLDPPVNLAVGVGYLRRAFELARGDVATTLAGYNGGHGQISRPHSSWPAETQRYVLWGSGIYADAARAAATSPTFDRWLAAGGESLCRQAGTRLAAR